jgi:biofilm protein TabA
MILDTLTQWRQYANISPRFEKAFTFLDRFDTHMSVGRYEIAGDDVFAFVQRHDTKPVNKGQYEAHRKYIDIQYIYRGCEAIYWAPLALLTNLTMPFDEKADVALFGHIPEGVAFQVRSGQFAILFPEDGHIPSCAWDQPAEVMKVVIKVKV